MNAAKVRKYYTKWTRGYQLICNSLEDQSDPTWTADSLGKSSVEELKNSYIHLEDKLSLFDREFLLKEPKE